MKKEESFIKNQKTIYEYQEGYLGKKVIELTLNDGSTKRIECLTKNKRNGDAVVIIPKISDNTFIVIKELRPNVSDKLCYEFPAGMIDENEEPSSAAKRELLEETGYKSEDLELLEWHYQDQGCSKAIIYTYIANNCQLLQKQQLDPSETIFVTQLSTEEIYNFIKNNQDFNDANSKIAFLSYLNHVNEKQK